MSATLYLLSTLGGYVLTSAFFLKCPGLLHRPKRQRFRCRHISHRGGAGENLENTMAAFHQCLPWIAKHHSNQKELGYLKP